MSDIPSYFSNELFSKPSNYLKPSIPIGATFDIPTGRYETGAYGESLLNGGLAYTTGIVSSGNRFKSTLAEYLRRSAHANTNPFEMFADIIYDTELNKEISRIVQLSQNFSAFSQSDLYEDKKIFITDRSKITGDQYWEFFQQLMEERSKNKSVYKETPFLGADKKSRIVIELPTFSLIDSLTDFETKDIDAIRKKTEIGASEGNTLPMRQGLGKFRLLSEIPAVVARHGHYMTLVGQEGKDIVIPTGPGTPPPKADLQFLPSNAKIKGVTQKFLFAMLNCWHIANSKVLYVQETKECEYPDPDIGTYPGDTDLNEITLKQLRGKFGPSGYTLKIIISQDNGVQPSLTEFHFIKNLKIKSLGIERFGITGSNQSYSLDLLPDVKLSRTTIRGKIKENPMLVRALNITSELAQLHIFNSELGKPLLCTPQELFNDLKSLGYDWDEILNTRGWWCWENDKHPIPYLSTLDLLKMRLKLYKPYWK